MGTHALPGKCGQNEVNGLSLPELVLHFVHEEGLTNPASYWGLIMLGWQMLPVALDDLKNVIGELCERIGRRKGWLFGGFLGFNFFDNDNQSMGTGRAVGDYLSYL